ncbi:MAG: hypothetical protein ABW022_04195 [Actinoplanes sp.]
MRARGLSFADAAALLGGESEAVSRLGKLAGAGAGAVTVASAGTVDFFALRGEAIRWGNAVVGRWREQVRGLSRFDRTDRLVAAHSVIVVVAFFEALDLPEARFTAAEQAALATGGPMADSYAEMVESLVRNPAPMPRPSETRAAHLRALQFHYATLATDVFNFLRRLTAFEALDFAKFADPLAQQAIRRYEELFRRLAAEVPEFQLWTAAIGEQATQHLVRQAIDALREQHAAADAVLDGLTRSYRRQLDRPILTSADAPGDLILPTLRDGYREPSGLVARAGPDDLPATQRWWDRYGKVTPHVPDLLIAGLTAPDATDGPVVVLGQPGSGKSVLTRTLAARLTEADFLPVRVELRAVRADSTVQAQIEEAVHAQLGERVSWPDLVRRAGTALPVVMMDGFDELLQATGQNWANYLEQLREFQQREAELGRPLAVLVTSRTVVADRARFPAGTTVVRLDPFDDDRVRAWLAVWNRLNAPGLTARGLKPLTAEAVLAHRELVSQPLLLLLLALYDGRANQLQNDGDGLGRVELYERLLTDFFERQVDKFGGRRSDEQRAGAVAAEWRRLCAVAVAMLNRGRDVILEPQLEADLHHLLSADDWTPGPGETPLTAAQLLVGRFFFIHESRALRDTGPVERSFEFLHATFGEYLAARQIVTALADLAEDRALLRRRPGATLDAGFFYALTSFATVTRRQPLWEFCQGLVARLDDATRRSCQALVRELLPEAGFPHPTWTLAGYEPERRPSAARDAAFSANLVALSVLLSDGPVDVADLAGAPVAVNWQRLALLWMSQLQPDDRRRLWQAFRLEWDLAADPARLLIRLEDGADVGILASLPWPPEEIPVPLEDAEDVRMPSDSQAGRLLRKSAFAQTGFDTREVFYILAPFWRRFGDVNFPHPSQKWDSDARSLLMAVIAEMDDAAPVERARRYAQALDHGSAAVTEAINSHLSRLTDVRFLRALADMMQASHKLGP